MVVQETAVAGQGINAALLDSMRWRLVGPFRGGRCVAVAGHPTDTQTFYMGTTGGGVWRTLDGGLSWHNLSDGFFKRASVGGIAIAGSDPNVIYVGMGESTIRGNVSHGDGVYKSLDGGETWTHCGLAATRNIGKIRIHPTNPDIVYVAALGHAHGPNPERGVYRSVDGGKTWELMLKRDENAGAVDLAIDPHNPRVIYASLWESRRGPHFLASGGPGSGIFKTTDGGDSWTELTRNEGLPEGTIGKVGIVPSPAQRGRVWAQIEAEEGGTFRSDDGGKTWERLSEERNLRQRAWYYSHIIADPRDAETVWVLNVECWKSTDGGKTFERVGVPHGDNHDFWIDPQNPQRMIEGNDGGAIISFNGGLHWTTIYNQPTAELYHVIADDQQPYRLYMAQQDNTTITVPSKSNLGSITNGESYAIGGGESGYIAIRPDDANIVFAGSYLGLITRYDHRTGQARTINVWPEYTLGAGAVDAKYRFQWTAPILLSPHDPDVLYITGNHVFRSHDEGTNWEILSPDLTRNDPSTLASSGGAITQDNTGAEYYGTIFAFTESAITPGLFWAGSDDGLIHLARDGGKNWTNVTPPADLLPEWALISIIEASPHDEGTAYVAATRYKLDDFAPYLLKTTDYGQSWTPIVAGLPGDLFMRVVREDPAHAGLLYCGTENAVWVSFDAGAAWQPFQLNLPVVPIHDLEVKGTDLIAATHGRSIWILDDLSPLHEVARRRTAGAERASLYDPATTILYPPRPAIRYGTGNDFGSTAKVGTSYLMTGATMTPYIKDQDKLGNDDNRLLDSAPNPPYGVLVHYVLPEETAKDKDKVKAVSLTFLDKDGNEIKGFRPKGTAEEEKKAKEAGDTDVRVSVAAGANRFLWDMRYAAPKKLVGDVSTAMSGTLEGAPAAPGEYRVRLTVGDVTQEQPFTIVPDPRSTATPEDFDAQFALQQQIGAKITDAHTAITQLRQVRSEVEAWEERAKEKPELARLPEVAKGLKEKLQKIEDELIQHRAKGVQDTLNFPIKLNAKLVFLAGVVGSGDGPPTQGAREVYSDLAARVDAQRELLKDVLYEDVVSFNSLVASFQLPAITPPE